MVNIITGRNNAGKTSLLQSVDIQFNPGNLLRYEGKVGKLIRNQCGPSKIEIEYKPSQPTIDDFRIGEGLEKTSHLQIRKPKNSELVDIFTQAIEQVLDLNREYPYNISESQKAKIIGDSDLDLSRISANALRESVSDLPEKKIIAEAEGSAVILELGDEEFPYIYLGDFYNKIRGEIIESAIRRVMDKIEVQTKEVSEVSDSDFQQLAEQLRSRFHAALIPRFGSGWFVKNEPEKTSGVRYVEDVAVSPNEIDLNKERNAVKAAKIERYLKENKIIDDLEDFSFGQIVFQKDEEEDPTTVPFDFMGEGFKNLVGVLWELYSQQNEEQVLLLEEPENHMHPGYVEQMAEHLVNISRKNGRQIFLSTHNLDFIKSFFSPHVKGENEDFLREEFQLIQLRDDLNRQFDYDRAENKVEMLDVDLRGI